MSGYSLEHLLPENEFDVAKFLSGTEGSLALTLGATVRLVDAPRATALAVLGYPDMPAAAEAVPGLLPHLPVALEGLDSRLVDVVRVRRGPAAVPELPRGGGWLFAETSGDTAEEAVAAARKLAADGACLDSAVFTGPQAAALWRIREDGAGLGGRTPAGAPAWPGWEDSAVPPASLGPYLRELAALMAAHGVDGLMYGHFGDGCVHVRIDFPLRDRPSVLRSFTDDAAKLAASYGGSASGEHGDGRARGELLAVMYSAAAIGLMRRGQAAVRPGQPAQPGDHRRPGAARRRPAGPRWRCRCGAASASPTPTTTGTSPPPCTAAWGSASAVPTPPRPAASCARRTWRRGMRRTPPGAAPGCCKSWPTARSSPAGTPRRSPSRLTSACPARAARVTARPASTWPRTRPRRFTSGTAAGSARPSHYSLGWLPRWAALVSRAPRLAGLANASLRLAPLAALVKRLGGIDSRRDLPTFAPESFRRWFAARRPGAGAGLSDTDEPDTGEPAPGAGGNRPPVYLWVDTFTNAFSPQVGRAAVAVLEAAGYEVRIAGGERLLRPDLDLHRPAGRRAPPAAPHAARPGAGH